MKFKLITFENTPENAREILANMGQNIDVIAGIFDKTMLEFRGCDGTEISREPFCVAVSIHHRLAKKEKITCNNFSMCNINWFICRLRNICWQSVSDLFEIEPKEPYTDKDLNWTNDDSRVSREHDDESLRDVELVSTTVEDWESYDTVFIGYPIWWAIAAWPVDNFVKDNDFTGKTVIPFCTAASSEIGDSGNLLEEMTGTGEWLEGESFHGGASESEVRSWIDSLNLK